MRKGRSRNGAGATSTRAHDPVSGSEKIPGAAEKINIPTDLLRTFVAICELGSFTKAAHLFNLTQPAVSAHMRRLESMIGADLIVKNLSGVTLTECGSDVLRHARRMLSVNDQIVGSGGQQPSLQVIRLGIPNIFAPTKLGPILSACRAKAGNARLQICCDHSFGLLRSVNSGYLDIVLSMGDEDEMKNALTSWPEEVVWARAPDFVLAPDAVVPLVSSPNLLFPDRMAREALDRANRRYEVVFTAFDTSARRAAAAAGIGYLSIPRLILPPSLVIEAPGVLPDLPSVTMGIVAREDLDTTELAPVLAAFEAVAKSPA
jgi:DNA-binding transcriptional LysR family regulator